MNLSTISVAGNFLTLNNGANLTSGATARVSTYKNFPIYLGSSTNINMLVNFSAAPVVNCIHEWGAFFASLSAAPTDGAFFRVNASGTLQCVVNINGAETVVTPTQTFATLVGVNATKSFLIYTGITETVFWINNIAVAVIPLAVTAGGNTSS